MQDQDANDRHSSPDEAPTVAREPQIAPASFGDAVASLEPGRTFGRFRIGRPLGRGGMGEVFEAEELGSGRRVALKVLTRPALAPAERGRFLREGRLAAAINHPNCVYVFGTEEIEGRPVISMELVPRGTLGQIVADQGPLDPQRAVDAILDVIAGLEAAETAGVLHRDVKPSNCFVDAHGRVKVGDFGLSVPAEGRSEETQLTVAGTFLGTPAYASPEQLRGETLDVRSDIYAVGATLFYLLTARAPFEQANLVSLVAAILQSEPSVPPAGRGGPPAGLAKVVLRCLSKSPGARFQGYEELRAALVPYASTRPSPAELGKRVLAWLVDGCPWFASGIIGFYAGSAWSFGFAGAAISLITYVLYFAVTEGLWGASAGKFLLRLRVVGLDGELPGLARATRRAIVFALLPGAPLLIAHASIADPGAFLVFMKTVVGQLLAWSSYVLLLGLFVTARGSNGFAGLHELVSGTRVVVRPRALGRPLFARQRAEGRPAPGGTSTVGPYETIGELGEQVRIGVDRALGREVWIHDGTSLDPILPASRRDLDRVGRLRWLSGRRTPEESWDAFAAPPGAPFLEVAAQPQPWRLVRHWLLDLAEELAAAARDRTLPGCIGPAHIWIGSDGRALLLDFPVPSRVPEEEITDVAEPASAQKLLYCTAIRALCGNGARRQGGDAHDAPEFPLPLGAHALLEDLCHQRISSLEDLVDRLTRLRRAPAELTPTRRAAHLACATAPLLLLLIPATFGVRLAADPGRSIERADVAALDVCLQALTDPRSPVPKDALEVYITGRFGHVATWLGPPAFDRGTGSSILHILGRSLLLESLDEEEQRRLRDLVERHPTPAPDAVHEAELALGPPFLERLEAKRAEKLRRADPDQPAAAIAFLWAFSACLWSAGATLAGVLFRGGPLLQLFGMAVVMRSGARAGRVRLVGRGFAAWLPYGVCFVIAVAWIPLALSEALPPSLRWLELAGIAAVPLVGLAWCVFRPPRGPHDRLAGTYLVPR